MKAHRSGNTSLLPMLALMLVLCLLMPAAHAGLSVSLDRYRISMGETVVLTLSSDSGVDPVDADLSALQNHFNILQRSTSVSTQFANGARTQVRELILELIPLREGSIVIPPFTVGSQRSEALAVDIGPEAQVAADGEIVTFEVELDRDQVYVQGQLLLTLRVQQAVNLESRSVTELDIDNAYVETLGQNSFQRMVDGRPWLVHEIRYAIFPESSGTLSIPAQTFSGRQGSGRRSLFDTQPAGRLIRRRTEEITVDVLPRPATFPGNTWLPAADLSIEERWSGALDQLRIGDSLTRTITVTGTGLQGAQLPPVEDPGIDGLRAYPDQPVINDVTGEIGVTGVRTDSLALVAVADGEYELPAVEIPWWDTQSNSLKTARLPARRVRVLPTPVPTTAMNRDPGVAITAPGSSPEKRAATLWPLIAAFCGIGWLLTALLWWRNGGQREQKARIERHPERRSPRQLIAACKKNDARLAQRELLAWLRGQGHRGPISGWQRELANAELDSAIADLERSLYRETDTDWNGSALARVVKSLEKTPPASAESALPALYLSR